MPKKPNKTAHFWKEDSDLLLITIRFITTPNILYAPFCLSRSLQFISPAAEMIQDWQNQHQANGAYPNR
jgi:hypothetical protein